MAKSMKCLHCGRLIQPCRCGGSACPGYCHVGAWEGHWCGTVKGTKAAVPK